MQYAELCIDDGATIARETAYCDTRRQSPRRTMRFWNIERRGGIYQSSGRHEACAACVCYNAAARCTYTLWFNNGAHSTPRTAACGISLVRSRQRNTFLESSSSILKRRSHSWNDKTDAIIYNFTTSRERENKSSLIEISFMQKSSNYSFRTYSSSIKWNGIEI